MKAHTATFFTRDGKRHVIDSIKAIAFSNEASTFLSSPDPRPALSRGARVILEATATRNHGRVHEMFWACQDYTQAQAWAILDGKR